MYSIGRGKLQWHFIGGCVLTEVVYQEVGEQDRSEKGVWKKVAQL